MSAIKPKAVIVQPVSTASGATTTITIDRLGYDECIIVASIGTAADTALPLAMAVTECDTSNGSYAAIVALTGGTATSTSAGFVMPATTATTATTTAHGLFQIDCKARKRYLQCSMTPGTVAVVSLVAILLQPEELPSGTTPQGAKVVASA